jgi:hypothetical protein
MDPLRSFLKDIEEDARISSAHISVYIALWKKLVDNNYEQPLSFFRAELIPVCKISGLNTYHKIIRQLHEYGYIKYIPSYNHFLGSLVYFTDVESKDKA